jgi:5-methylthioadenosine/S-adenosylhomocysteine deaminase
MTAPEMILAGDALLTMDVENRVIPMGALLIRDGRIEALGPVSELAPLHLDVQVKYVPNSVLMPGLINAHAHSGFCAGPPSICRCGSG